MKKTHTSPYRPEVDGLRALAVVPVILFHFSGDFLPNGFLGVDVFFVISGYLISQILLRSFSDGTFSFFRFWERRVRRLFPALATTLIVSLTAGWFVLFGSEWKSVSMQSLATLTSSANILYWRTAGDYWGQTAESMPLLHMWSLAVEEQFYILYPAMLLAVTRLMSPRCVRWTLLSTAVCSCILMAVGLIKFRAAAFYLLPCRMWELLMGGFLASLDTPGPSKIRPWLSAVGLILLMATYLFPASRGVFSLPGCLSAVVATGLILRYAESKSITTRILSARPFVLIGQMSYSLYLWHWPVIVLGPLFLRMSVVATGCVIFCLSYLSWSLVERRMRYLSGGRFAVISSGMLAALLISMWLPFVAERPTLRFRPPSYNAAANIQPPYIANVDGWVGRWDTGLTLGNLQDSEAVSMVLLGDSHGVMYFSPVKQAAEATGLMLTSFAADGGTSPFMVPEGEPTTDYGPSWDHKDRLRFDQVRRQFIAKHRPRIAVLTGRWAHYLTLHGADGLQRHVCELIDVFPAETRVIIIGQPPELPFGSGGFQEGELSIPPLRAFFEDAETSRRRVTAHQIFNQVAASDSRVRFVDVQPIFNTPGGIRFLEGQVMLYKDDDHLSMEGAALCREIIRKAVSDAVSHDKTSI
jgi:peptidoglycan/LPS O-acetylase OafA/YrhL